MKASTKLITLVIALTFLVSFSGCAPQATQTAQPGATQPPAGATQPPAAATQPPASTEPVTLSYANWNLGTEEENNIQRQMVKAYTDKNPNVTIKFVDMSAEGGWEAVLTSYAAKGELPDVFMANNVPLYASNGWLADLTDLVKDDADWKNVPQALKDGFTYGGKVLGLPAAQFVMGYFVNKDLFEAANLDAPEYGVSVDEFFKAATALNNVSKGILGLDEQGNVLGWYASTQDKKLKWFSYDGTKMNYNSAAFKAAIAKTGEMKPYTWQGLSEEQMKTFKSKGPWELFLNQEVGVRWDASWAVPDLVKTAKFNWDFVGIPGGNQALVADVFVISKTATDVQQAFRFAKWMTFSTEAYKTETELAKTLGIAPKMPVSVDAASVELYKTFVSVPGVLKALDNLNDSLVESLAKVIPGYINARWEGKPGINVGDDKDVNVGYMFDNATSGKFKYEDYAAKLEEFSNKILVDAQAAINK